MNEITKMYIKKQQQSGLTYKKFVETITNEEHKMMMQWGILKKHTRLTSSPQYIRDNKHLFVKGGK